MNRLNISSVFNTYNFGVVTGALYLYIFHFLSRNYCYKNFINFLRSLILRDSKNEINNTENASSVNNNNEENNSSNIDNDNNNSSIIPTWETGECLRISCEGKSVIVLVERVQDKKFQKNQDKKGLQSHPSIFVYLSLRSRPFSKLQIANMETGVVDWEGKIFEKDSYWLIDQPYSNITQICNIDCEIAKKNKKSPTIISNLAANDQGIFTKVKNLEEPIDTKTCMWKIEPMAATSTIASYESIRPLHSLKRISDQQLTSFVHDGYCVMRNIVPPYVLAKAQIELNKTLGRPNGITSFLEIDEVPLKRPPSGYGEAGIPFKADNTTGRLAREASFNTNLILPAACPEVLSYIAQLIGNGKVAPIKAVQVALRFPGQCDDTLVVNGAAMRDTVNGSSWHTDGLRQGKKHSFSILVGVALSDMLVSNVGNLCLWPRSHLHIHHWQRHPDGLIARPGGGNRDTDGPLPDIGTPIQVKMKAGDVCLVHSEVGHCGAPHLGTNIRSMLYYRVRHKDWKEMCAGGDMVDDMWCDLEGVKDLPEAKILRKGCLFPPDINNCSHTCGTNDEHKCY